MKTIRDTHFVTEWIDMEPKVPEPRIDWIQTKYLDLAYGEDPLQKVDLYMPEGKKDVPLLVVIHGGGWCCCDKRDWHLYPAFYALERGFAVASVNYRLAPAVQFPTPLQDVKAAIHFLKENAEQYGYRKDAVFLYGTSAGGNLAALAGLQNAGTEDAVAAVADLCGLVDFENQWKFWDAFEVIASDYVKISRVQYFQYMKESPEQNPEYVRSAGAKQYITKDAPPFYIQHGTMDPAVPVEQAYRFAQQLRETCGEDSVVLDLLDGVGHAGGGPEYLEKENIDPILNFFLDVLKKNSAE